MESYSDDEIIRLYNSFVESVKSGGDLSEYSEDDLLDIFDYASGIPDDATSAEVIICGERRFPASNDLLKRKAFLFHQLGQEEACRGVLRRLSGKSFLRRILGIVESSELHDVYESIVDCIERLPSGKIEDGDIMYLVDIFDSSGELQFLADNADRFSRISEYPSTIYNELFHLYWEKGDYTQAVEFGRKVTEAEPFNSNAWTELADLYNIHIKDSRAAVECADFALAIDPESLGAMVVKSSALYESDPEESRQVVSQLTQIAPEDPLVLYAEAILNINDGDRQKGIEYLEKALAIAVPSQYRNIFNVLLSVIDAPLDQPLCAKLKELFETDGTVDAVRWCSELISSGSYAGAYEVFRAAYESGRMDLTDPDSVMLGAEALYRMGYYGSVVELLEAGFSGLDENLLHLTFPLALIYVLSMYRTGVKDPEEIRTYIECKMAFHQVDQTQYNLSYRLMNQSAMKRMSDFKDYLDAGLDPDLTRIDPFI